MTNTNDSRTPIERIYAVMDRLSAKHTEQIWNGETILSVKRDPLLQQIRSAMYGDLGRTESGKSAAAQERSVLDVAAFTIYEDITGRIEAFHQYLTKQPKRETPEETLRAWYVAFDSQFRAGKYTEQQVLRTLSQLNKFASRISGHFDQPRVKEIAGPCPQCTAAHFKDTQGANQTSLYASYKAGEQPYVRCRGCGAEWTGERTLLELGYHLGAQVDEDTLREMGVIV